MATTGFTRGLSRVFQRQSAEPGARVGTVSVPGGEFLFISERQLHEVITTLRTMPSVHYGSAIYIQPLLHNRITKEEILEFANKVISIVKSGFSDDNLIPRLYMVLEHRVFLKSRIRDTLSWVADFLFATNLVLIVSPNERFSPQLEQYDPRIALDLRQAEFSGDRTKAVASLRLNIQNFKSTFKGLQLILAPRRFRLELLVLSIGAGADLAIDMDQYTAALRARYYAAANAYYELSKSPGAEGAKHAYARLAMEYFLGEDSVISPERHEKTADILRVGGPFVHPEYSRKFIVDGKSPSDEDRGKFSRNKISQMHGIAARILRHFGRYRAQLVGSMSSPIRDLVPHDIDIIVAVSGSAEFQSEIEKLMIFLGKGKTRLETKNPNRYARIAYSDSDSDSDGTIFIDLFAAETLTGLEAHSRVLSSTENIYYRTIAKEKGFLLNDNFLQVSASKKVFDMREILQILEVNHPGIDIRDLRNWYFGLVNY